MVNLKDQLEKSLEENGEEKSDIVEIKLFTTSRFRDVESSSEVDSLEDLDIEYDNGYGMEDGPRFWVWTEDRIYFKQIYDGSESIASVPRNPTDTTPPVIGGG